MSRDTGLASLPWRGPGSDRPDALALPPERMPLRYDGVWRKRWRYLGAYSDELMLCAARVDVGLFGQSFWAVWDRENDKLYERTMNRLPGARGQVWTETLDGEPVERAPDEGSVVRIETKHPEVGEVRARLTGGPGAWAECVCPAGDGGYVWTRKRAGVDVECNIKLGERRIRAKALGVEDETAGYHPRHTVWSWSAGVGRSSDGRTVGWNLVQGVNDPHHSSERAIWIDGTPTEPGPVRFDGLDAVDFDTGERLGFEAESERAKSENRIVVSYSYRQPFGRFAGTLPGGIELESGIGVMEHHDAKW